MDKKKVNIPELTFKPTDWKELATAVVVGEATDISMSPMAEKELSAKMKKMLVNAAMEYFTPYGIPMSEYKASVEMISDVTVKVTFVKKDKPEVTLVLEDIYFDESTGDILQATPQLG